jgi:hypothetical protein
LQFSELSPDTQFGGLQAEIVESLRTFFDIFPFSGRLRPETRFDPYCVAGVAVNLRPFGPLDGGAGARKSFDKIDLANSMFPCLMARQGIKGVRVVAMRQRIRIKGEKRWT